MASGDRRRKVEQVRRNDILDAAENLFFSRGINPTTVDEIARKADYSKRTIYCYFSSKEQIVYALVLRALKVLNEQLRDPDPASSETGLDRVMELCDGFLAFASLHPHYFNLISLYESWKIDAREKDPVKEACLAEGRRIFEQLVRALRRGQADRSIRRHRDVTGTAFVLYANVMGTANILIHWNRYAEAIQGKSAGEITGAMRDFILRALRGLA